ncbi:hypothetical protein [Nocardioides zeae]|uniref:Alkaline shock family protein YloU n=1 Tax=Nocardioides zeae TaxID=1457234 RepID=A0AAJ1U4K2_9ACTN|nr:hypothetical protein [Nocardioides zeae]MDQ1105378.1 putative alkaline shock family protein YloU [Nocardioides zeae]
MTHEAPETAGEPEVDVADQVAAAVLAVPGVHALHPGAFGEIATYLPGRRVAGVRVADERCEVHVVLQYPAPLAATTDAVRAAVRAVVPGPVDVTVGDVVDPAAP